VNETGSPAFGIAASVVEIPERPALPGTPGEPGRTMVTLRLPSAAPAHATASLPSLQPPAPEPGPLVDSLASPTKPWSATDLAAAAQTTPFDLDDLFDSLMASPWPAPEAIVFRARTSIFGHNAPDYSALPSVMKDKQPEYAADGTIKGVDAPYAKCSGMWAENKLDKYPSEDKPDTEEPSGKLIYLDSTSSAVSTGSPVVLNDGGTWGLYSVTAAADISRTAFTLTGKTTRLTLDSGEGFASFGIRTTTVFVAGIRMPLARQTVSAPVEGETVDLGGWYPGLLPGRTVIVTGEPEDVPGTTASQTRVLAAVDHHLAQPNGPDPSGTTITLDPPLVGRYVRGTVAINGNVAAATHGETVREVLGSGDGRATFQRFALRQSPLTHISSSDPTGTATTLSVYVNEVRWREVDTLVGAGPNDRVYTCELADDGATTIQFGDGITGARLPTGVENIRAVYRKGSGLDGQVNAGQLTLLGARPAGVVGVTNPTAPSGADDRESLADARQNAPLTVRSLDRIVSLQDYEDFTRAFPGVDKAHATWTRSGEQRGILITVLGPRGVVLEAGMPVFDNLLDALRQSGDPYLPVRLLSVPPGLFRLMARVKTDPDQVRDTILANVVRALRTTFAFPERSFGQPVTLSEVIATIQSVTGVVATDVEELYRLPGPTKAQPELVLEAAVPRPGSDPSALPAEMLILDPAPISLGNLP